jgi:hypothetical protein
VTLRPTRPQRTILRDLRIAAKEYAARHHRDPERAWLGWYEWEAASKGFSIMGAEPRGDSVEATIQSFLTESVEVRRSPIMSDGVIAIGAGQWNAEAVEYYHTYDNPAEWAPLTRGRLAASVGATIDESNAYAEAQQKQIATVAEALAGLPKIRTRWEVRSFDNIDTPVRIESVTPLTGGGPIEPGRITISASIANDESLLVPIDASIQWMPKRWTVGEAARELADRFLSQAKAMPDDVFRRALAAIYGQSHTDANEWTDPQTGITWTIISGAWASNGAAAPPPETNPQQSATSAGETSLSAECSCGKKLDQRDLTKDRKHVTCYWCGCKTPVKV